MKALLDKYTDFGAFVCFEVQIMMADKRESSKFYSHFMTVLVVSFTFCKFKLEYGYEQFV